MAERTRELNRVNAHLQHISLTDSLTDLPNRRCAMEKLDVFWNDDLVCRLGGDEFLVICPNTDLEGAVLKAEKMRQLVTAVEVDTRGVPGAEV